MLDINVYWMLGIIILFTALILCTILGNGLVLQAVRIDPKLQTVGNMYIVSLALSDIVVGLTVMPISAIYVIQDEWRFGRVFCKMWMITDYVVSTASILNLFILSMDRYWSIKNPLDYLHKRTKARALMFILIAWLLSSIWIFPHVFWNKDYFIQYLQSNNTGIQRCFAPFRENLPFKLITAGFNFFLPVCVMYTMYAKVFNIIRSRVSLMNKGESRRSVGGNNVGASLKATNVPAIRLHEKELLLQSGDESDSVSSRRKFTVDSDMHCRRARRRERLLSKNPTTSDVWARRQSHFSISSVDSQISYDPGGQLNQISETENRISAPTKARLRRLSYMRTEKQSRHAKEKRKLSDQFKAAKQLGTIMGAFTLCFLPYFTVFIVDTFIEIPFWIETIVVWFGYINSTLNPLVYNFTNAKFKKRFKIMLGIIPQPVRDKVQGFTSAMSHSRASVAPPYRRSHSKTDIITRKRISVHARKSKSEATSPCLSYANVNLDGPLNSDYMINDHFSSCSPRRKASILRGGILSDQNLSAALGISVTVV